MGLWPGLQGLAKQAFVYMIPAFSDKEEQRTTLLVIWPTYSFDFCNFLPELIMDASKGL
jgi:hypothetical protein